MSRVIGAGVTGLAAARAIARARALDCVLERHPRPGLDTSTHNSGVIHAGIYYPAGSLKARLCVEGRHLLYEFCAEHGVAARALRQAHRRQRRRSEVAELEALLTRGRDNGVEGLDARRSRRSSRHASRTSTRWRPSTRRRPASSTPRSWSRRCSAPAKAAGVMFLPGTRLVGAEPARRRHPASHRARNDSGRSGRQRRRPVCGRRVATARRRALHDLPVPRRVRRAHAGQAIARQRARLSASARLGHGLGVHLVRTTDGAVWLGPTVALSGSQGRLRERPSAGRSVRRAGAPAAAGASTLEDLRLSGSGIRAKLHPPDESFADFLIRRDRENPAVVQAAGIESPG